MLETTGLADPAPVLQTMMAHPYLVMRYRLDGIITMVDAVNGDATLDAHAEAVKQVAVADRIVLTKTDLDRPRGRDRSVARAAAPAQSGRTHSRRCGRRRIAGGAVRLRALRSGRARFRTWRDGLREEAYADHAHDHRGHHGHTHHHDVNRHDATSALSLTADRPMTMAGRSTCFSICCARRTGRICCG